MHRCSIGSTITQQTCIAVRVIDRLSYNQHCWCQLDRNCDQPTSTTANIVDDTAYFFASAPSWAWNTVEHGHKFWAVRRFFSTGRKHNFYLPRLHLALSLGVIPSEFRIERFFCAVVRRCLWDAKFSRLDTIPVCDRQTDRRTRDDSEYRTSKHSVARVKVSGC